MGKCANCGAPLDATSYSCKFCGYIISERIKRVSEAREGMTYERQMSVIEDNLNALHLIPTPGFGAALLDVIRVYLIIVTLGIVAIFWKRPKKRFKRENFNMLKNTVKRNLYFLEESAKGMPELEQRTDYLRSELEDITKKVQRGYTVKVATYVLVPVFIILLGVLNPDDASEQAARMYIKPLQTEADGRAPEHLLEVLSLEDKEHVLLRDDDIFERDVNYTLSVSIHKAEGFVFDTASVFEPELRFLRSPRYISTNFYAKPKKESIAAFNEFLKSDTALSVNVEYYIRANKVRWLNSEDTIVYDKFVLYVVK